MNTNKPPKRHNDISMELIVGTVALMILLALSYFTIVVGRQAFWRKTYPMEVYFDSVMGLRDGDNVVIRGMTVGKIRSLTLVSNEVLVVSDLSRMLQMHRDYRIRVVFTSVLGGRQLEVSEGSADAPLLPPEARLHGDPPVDLIDDAAAMIKDVRNMINEGGVASNISATAANLSAISGRLKRGEGTIGRLLVEDGVYVQLQGTMTEASNALAQIKVVTTKLSQGEGTLGKLLMDDRVYKDIEKTTANLRDVTDRVNAGQGTLGKLLARDDSMYLNLLATARSLSNITARVENGDGLLGKLIGDETLATNVQQTIQELRAAIDDFRETSPVVSFSSFLFGTF